MAATETRAPRARCAGIARLGKRTKHLIKRLRRGDVAIIDHLDIDRVSAEDLISCGVETVVNCAHSTSGYPNTGPLLLVQAGIHLVDAPGTRLFERLDDGDRCWCAAARSCGAATWSSRGEVQDPATVRPSPRSAGRRSARRWRRSPRTRSRHGPERELLAGKLELPQFATDFRDRTALVVVRGVDHKRDLRALRSYIRENRPVLVGVDGGADAILDDGFELDMVVGDMDSATEGTLRSGAELVVHAYPDGRAPGRERWRRWAALQGGPGAGHQPGRGDADRLREGRPADRLGGLALQPGRVPRQAAQGMSSTFLTRLRIGEILVDAKGVSRLYEPRPGRRRCCWCSPRG